MNTQWNTVDPAMIGLPLAPRVQPGFAAHWSVIVVASALATPGTSSAEPKRIWETRYVIGPERTASSPSWQMPDPTEPLEDTRDAISDLRRISGLTWEQLAELFGVSRRSVHFWASGKPLNAANEQRLLRTLDVVRYADRGTARLTRAALSTSRGGSSPFDLLVAERFDEARALLGAGPGHGVVARAELDAHAKASRRPLSPEELVDAEHDSVHRDVGRGRPARIAARKRHGRGR